MANGLRERMVSAKRAVEFTNPKLRRRFPGRTLRFVVKTIEQGPNEGRRHLMRVFRDPQGKTHTSPVGGTPAAARRRASNLRRRMTA